MPLPVTDTSLPERSLDLRGTNQSGMRAQNERLVLSLVRRHQALAKSEIARMTGLSAQTVSVIVRELEDDGLMLRGEPIRGKVGQPSVPMRLNPEGAYFLGLKIGRRSAEMVLTDFLGNVHSRAMRTYAYPTPNAALAFADTQIEALIAGLPRRHRDRVSGLGIAMPFFLWDWAQALNVPADRMEPWRHRDIRADLANRHSLPIFVQNDATAACGAELVFGPSDGPRNFLYFYVGFFIGGGVVLNGSIYSGRGNAGALGPLPVSDGNSRVHPLIDAASLCVLERALSAAGYSAEAIWESADSWTIPDEMVEEWIQSAGYGLAQATVSACSVVDFESVKIDGWLPIDVRDRLVAEIERQMSKLNLTGLERPTIVAGSVGPDARALGAASLPLSERYLVDRNALPGPISGASNP